MAQHVLTPVADHYNPTEVNVSQRHWTPSPVFQLINASVSNRTQSAKTAKVTASSGQFFGGLRQIVFDLSQNTGTNQFPDAAVNVLEAVLELDFQYVWVGEQIFLQFQILEAEGTVSVPSSEFQIATMQSLVLQPGVYTPNTPTTVTLPFVILKNAISEGWNNCKLDVRATLPSVNGEPAVEIFNVRVLTEWTNQELVVDTPTTTLAAVRDPSCSDDSYVLEQNQTLTVTAPGLLANDDAGSTGQTNLDTELSITENTSPASGTLSVSETGAFTFTPAVDYTGTLTFTYTARSSAGTDTGTVTIVVYDPEEGPPTVSTEPVLVNDTYITDVNQELTVNPENGVLSNDTRNGYSAWFASLVPDAGPMHGQLTFFSSGGFRYVPNTDYVGPDQFSYQVGSNYATVNIDIAGDSVQTSALSTVKKQELQASAVKIMQVMQTRPPVDFDVEVIPNRLVVFADTVTGRYNGSVKTSVVLDPGPSLEKLRDIQELITLSVPESGIVTYKDKTPATSTEGSIKVTASPNTFILPPSTHHLACKVAVNNDTDSVKEITLSLSTDSEQSLPLLSHQQVSLKPSETREIVLAIRTTASGAKVENIRIQAIDNSNGRTVATEYVTVNQNSNNTDPELFTITTSDPISVEIGSTVSIVLATANSPTTDGNQFWSNSSPEFLLDHDMDLSSNGVLSSAEVIGPPTTGTLVVVCREENSTSRHYAAKIFTINIS